MNYENNVSKYSNIEISKNKSLYINILESLGMIQFNCTTAFEYLAITKKKSIFPIFLKNNYKINKEMLAVSNIVDSLFKFEMKIRKLITVKQKKERFLNLNFIENIFYKIDGCATDRIVNNISKIIVNKNDYKIKKNFYLFKNFKEFLYLFFYYLDINFFIKVRNFFIKKNREKELSLTIINELIKENQVLLNKKKFNYTINRARVDFGMGFNKNIISFKISK